MKSILFVPFYVGELGWEIVNYIPHVNYLLKRNKYDEVHVVLKKDHEALYPMGTHFYTAAMKRDKSMGNSGDDIPGISKEVWKDLKHRDDIKAISVDRPKPGMKFYKRRSFLRYKPTEECPDIPKNSVLLCIRGRKFGHYKNWGIKNWKGLCEYIQSKDLVPVLSGVTGMTVFDAPEGCIDLRNKTTLADMINLMHHCKFVMGGSTGTTHLAALCSVRHAVWGTRRIKERYVRSWNPFHAPLEYCSCNKDWTFSFDEGKKLAKRMIKTLEN